MDKDQASELLAKYHKGECTLQEERMLFEAFNRVPLPDRAALSDAAYQRLEASGLEIIRHKIGQKERHAFRRWMPLVAAAVLLAFLSVAYFFLSIPADTGGNITASEVFPGGNRATLSIVGGQSLQLDTNQSSIVMNGEDIAYADNTSIRGLTSEDGDYDSGIMALVLTTPKGGNYRATLSDGTQVWLNAASTLKYPSQFDEKERRVEIIGEAYFSVAKDPKRPFRVVSNGQEIEVLGTEFNIAAYPEEKATKTTLLEGAVRLRVTTTGVSISLVPGEQAVSAGGAIAKQHVDTEPFVAWKEGYFKLNGSLRSIMAQIGRWYDVDVIFQRNVDANMELVGEISRDVKLSDILLMINEIDDGLKFELDEITTTKPGESEHKRRRRLRIMR